MDEKKYLGVDIGGTKCAVVLGDARCDIARRSAFPTGIDISSERMMEGIYREIDAALDSPLAGGSVRAIGISCGGPLNSRKGVIESPPNLPLLSHLPIVRLLEARYGVNAFLQNDANACALAEWRFGAGRGCENLAFLTFGTGLGAGLILNGRLYCGASDMAGELGHIRLSADGPVGYGKSGSFEGFCSGGGLKQLGQAAAKAALDKGKPALFCQNEAALAHIGAGDIVRAADCGDETALLILEESARRLGQGLAILIDLINPERIIIGSIYARAERYFRDRALEVIRREALSLSAEACQIVPASLGDSVGDIACLSIAIDAVERAGKAGNAP